jgi:hypothetical protein
LENKTHIDNINNVSTADMFNTDREFKYKNHDKCKIKQCYKKE